MTDPDPVLHLLAGPNGAGKTTLFRTVLEPVTGLPWVNADDIAAALGGVVEEQAYRASELAASSRAALLDRRTSFVTETVFSHPSKVDLVRDARDRGYLVTLHIVMVPEALSVARVASRVEKGGHAVPEVKIRERHRRLWTYVTGAVGLAHQAFVYDNSRLAPPFRRVARFEAGRLAGAADLPPWTPEEVVALVDQG